MRRADGERESKAIIKENNGEGGANGHEAAQLVVVLENCLVWLVVEFALVWEEWKNGELENAHCLYISHMKYVHAFSYLFTIYYEEKR